ncbi:MAG: TlpA family protein disulfide reductase [Verrucomicrobiales bacterium]|nr:TlpA family protein disulfide reductase [Verrucomicrobiales bacterium]
MEALLSGKPVPVEKTRPHGCSTKWAYKSDLVTKFNAEFEAKEVFLDLIDAKAVKKLAANSTEKLRLINIWSTMCGPCVAEMPELVEIGRQFETRGFDMITITLDDKGHKSKVETMLRRFHAAMPRLTEASVKEEGRRTNNYLFTGTTDELAEALDSEWQGPLPYTVLIAPGGKIIFRHDGEIDPAGLKTEIVDFLGRFYQPAP